MTNAKVRQVDEVFGELAFALEAEAEGARYDAAATKDESARDRLIGRAEAFTAGAVLARRAQVAAGGSPELPKSRLKRGLDWNDRADGGAASAQIGTTDLLWCITEARRRTRRGDIAAAESADEALAVLLVLSRAADLNGPDATGERLQLALTAVTDALECSPICETPLAAIAQIRRLATVARADGAVLDMWSAIAPAERWLAACAAIDALVPLLARPPEEDWRHLYRRAPAEPDFPADHFPTDDFPADDFGDMDIPF